MSLGVLSSMNQIGAERLGCFQCRKGKTSTNRRFCLEKKTGVDSRAGVADESPLQRVMGTID